ncbi:MAG TPA: hypothetical protein PKK20_03630 [Verrucomicrobiota bacterium]|mgnify:FL=1|jgi:hypothetical protein|nr:hypothetical protein [Verrucomicrobiota bacterium]HNU99009.1 hypothetical protein [Verrucomicrobiota bacterium]HOF48960.1 hypothetical protein [Verrucomicrobiota bacterium]HOU86998.1 hypothetical protein [Verrucomicrobiota bacterium]HPK98609.1 hypothetical protein [Verrucomicrobiota bacterium]
MRRGDALRSPGSSGSNGSRRDFLRRNLQAGGLLGVVGALTASGLNVRAARGSAENPFAYDVGKFERTDANLIHYAETARFQSPRPEPRRLALGPDGALHMAAGDSVVRLAEGGAVEFEIALAGPAQCLGVARDGLVYVGLRDHIEVFDAGGQRTAVWSPPGSKTWLTGLAVGEDDLFAADSGGRAVLRYDRSGRLLGRIGDRNKERGIPGFVLPSPFLDVEWHRDGLLRVNNPGRHRVELYTASGDLELAWGKPTAAIDGFCGCCNPIHLATLPDGRCVTCEKGLRRVKVYSALGEFESVVAGPESFAQSVPPGVSMAKAALDAAADAQGRIFILDPLAGEIRVMTRKRGTTAA